MSYSSVALIKYSDQSDSQKKEITVAYGFRRLDKVHNVKDSESAGGWSMKLRYDIFSHKPVCREQSRQTWAEREKQCEAMNAQACLQRILHDSSSCKTGPPKHPQIAPPTGEKWHDLNSLGLGMSLKPP